MATRVAGEIDEHLRAFFTSRALAALWELVGAANRYIDREAPWKLAKETEQRAHLGTVLYESLEVLRVIAVLLESFLPETSGRILSALGNPPRPELLPDAVVWGQLPPGTSTRLTEALFPRIEAS